MITFAIDHTKGANFTQNDGVTETKNVADARKVAYHVTAAGNAETLRNYTLNGKNLEAGDLAASGDGEITRRVLSLDLVQKTGIDKEYDREKKLRTVRRQRINLSQMTGRALLSRRATATMPIRQRIRRSSTTALPLTIRKFSTTLPLQAGM